MCSILIHKAKARVFSSPPSLLFFSSSFSWKIYVMSIGCLQPCKFSGTVRCLQLSVSPPTQLLSSLLRIWKQTHLAQLWKVQPYWFVISFLFLVTQVTWVDLCVYSACSSERLHIRKSCMRTEKKSVCLCMMLFLIMLMIFLRLHMCCEV